MLQLLFLTLALLGARVHTSCISDSEESKAMHNMDVALLDDLYQLLKEGLLNNDTAQENLGAIKEGFNFRKQKLCIRLNYTITCTEEEECDTTSSTINCSTGYSSAHIWLSFDPDTLSGKFLLHYAMLNYTILGLHWGEACDLRPAATINLRITVPSLALCGVKEEYINESLKRLTKQVSLHYYEMLNALGSGSDL